MPKNIVFCADGTWNDPDKDVNKDKIADHTNVYKLFSCLDGENTGSPSKMEQEKILKSEGEIKQVAKYLHGVGSSNNWLSQAAGGAFGAGVISRIVRGFTFISRNYEKGDSIFLVGFSRGAYTARALAGLISSQGLLNPSQIKDNDLRKAYSLGTKAWCSYRASGPGVGWQEYLEKRFNMDFGIDLQGNNTFKQLLKPALRETDLIPIDKIAAVAVWDTVGAMGIPNYNQEGVRVDQFQFTDMTLSNKVGTGLHAVALDEQRNDFTPALWDPASNVTQLLFPGAHSDVGGGYPTSNNESGLSDIALEWMIKNLVDVDVAFSQDKVKQITPDPGGVAHKPWEELPWTLPIFKSAPRTFPSHLKEHPSIEQRAVMDKVVAHPGKPAGQYKPTNRPS